MRKSNHEAIRALLRTESDGLPLAEIASRLAVDASSAWRSLHAMPDVYID